MTEKSEIKCTLDRIRSELAEGEVRSLLRETETGRLTCSITAVDALACSFDSMTVLSEHAADATVDQLKRTGERLVAKLGYLMEPLDVIEVDELSRVVQLRSRPPHREDESIRYYELELRPGEGRLRRYEKRPGCLREAIPITVTREVFRRLVDDLASTAS